MHCITGCPYQHHPHQGSRLPAPNMCPAPVYQAVLWPDHQASGWKIIFYLNVKYDHTVKQQKVQLPAYISTYALQ